MKRSFVAYTCVMEFIMFLFEFLLNQRFMLFAGWFTLFSRFPLLCMQTAIVLLHIVIMFSVWLFFLLTRLCVNHRLQSALQCTVFTRFGVLINADHSIVYRQSSTAAHNFRTILQQQLDDIHAAGTFKNERIISSPQKTAINIKDSAQSVINFCANNYLGMSVSVKKIILSNFIYTCYTNWKIIRFSWFDICLITNDGHA